MRGIRLVLCALTLAAALDVAAWTEGAGIACAPGCESVGNCNRDFGTCECPRGRTGMWALKHPGGHVAECLLDRRDRPVSMHAACQHACSSTAAGSSLQPCKAHPKRMLCGRHHHILCNQPSAQLMFHDIHSSQVSSRPWSLVPGKGVDATALPLIHWPRSRSNNGRFTFRGQERVVLKREPHNSPQNYSIG